MNLAIAITTAPRPTATLTRSLASLRAAGVTSPVLVSVDGLDVPAIDAACTLLQGPPIGVFRHWVRTLRAVLAWSPADRLLILQDDVTWAAQSAAAMTGTLDRLAPFWSWYVDPFVGRDLERRYGTLTPGPYLSPLGFDSNGALSYGFSRALAQQILRTPRLTRELAHHTRGIDKRIPAICADLGQPLQVWIPSLISHVLGSGNSSIKPKRPKDTQYWQPIAPVEAWCTSSSPA